VRMRVRVCAHVRRGELGVAMGTCVGGRHSHTAAAVGRGWVLGGRDEELARAAAAAAAHVVVGIAAAAVYECGVADVRVSGASVSGCTGRAAAVHTHPHLHPCPPLRTRSPVLPASRRRRSCYPSRKKTKIYHVHAPACEHIHKNI
jgi:hypothetical protein